MSSRTARAGKPISKTQNKQKCDIYTCTCFYMCRYMQVCMFVCACGGQRLTFTVFLISSSLYLKIYSYYLHERMCHIWGQGPRKPRPLIGAGVTRVCSDPIRALGTKLWSSVRPASSLNCRPISPSPTIFFDT